MLKWYRDGFVGLGFVILILAIGVFAINKYFNVINSQLKHLQVSGRNRSIELASSALSRKDSEVRLKSLDPFMKSWSPYLEQTQEAPKVLNDIVSFSFKNTIAVAEKSAQIGRSTPIAGVDSSILITLKVIGKFERIYHWLGEIESKYPHALISELILKSENRNAAVKLTLDLPLLSS